ncbi:MAG TPA: SDR family NAD(P)-dependent oxidoreductase [Nitriliruptorales bacterium]
MRIDTSTSAIVTGGASGLGEATVRRLHASGAPVVIVDLNKQKGDELARDLGDGVEFVPVDVTDEAGVQAAVDAAAGLGELRICINCAGIGVEAARTVTRGPTAYPLERFERAVRVNLVGTFNVVRLAATRMAGYEPIDDEGQRGVIVNTASLAAFDGQTGQVAYAAAKAGVAGMTLPLARDLSAVGVRVCTIAPGTFDTPIFQAPGAPGEYIEQFQGALLADNAFPRRLGQADEFAALAEHILRNDMLNGETIRLDAGARLRANPGH